MSTKRIVGLAIAVSLFAATVAAAGLAVAAQSRGDGAGESGNIVHLTVHHSRFVPDHVTVRAGTTVRFVIENTDPILHEFIIGDAGVHERHEKGTEPRHPPRPGEVTVDPGTTADTTYHFDGVTSGSAGGSVLYACHLPAHFAYGMFGNVTVST